MTTYAVCTSWKSDTFGFEASFKRCWPESVRLYITTDRTLASDPEFLRFEHEAPHDGADYRFNALKFAHKVFTVTTPPEEYADWWIWLDADTETLKPIDERFLKTACPEGYMGSYLGRKDWHHSECGWVAYSLREGAGKFLARFREVYTSGEIYEHLEWHDSYIFDRVREEFPEDAWFNLSEGVPGMHPWDSTILGEHMRHYKGPLRKEGRTADVPESYWSEQERAL